MTLVELMVVVGIILLLAALIIPRIQPNVEQARIREAARSVSVFLNAARVNAIESGRPVGVAFQRLAAQGDACSVAFQIELPPPYAGESLDARLRPALGQGTIVCQVSVGAIDDGLIRPGDRVQLNFQGPWYQIAPLVSSTDPGPNPDSNKDGYLDFGAGTDNNADGFYDNLVLVLIPPSFGVAALPWPSVPNFGPAVPFRVERQASLDSALTGFGGGLIRSAVPPLRLPENVVVDLGGSGFGSGTQFANTLAALQPDPPVFLLFSPIGMVEQLGYGPAGSYVRQSVTEPIFLLIGRWDRMPTSPGGASAAEDGLLNWQDGQNLWIAISPQTGLVTVADVAMDQTLPSGMRIPSSLDVSRRFAREAQIAKGGR